MAGTCERCGGPLKSYLGALCEDCLFHRPEPPPAPRCVICGRKWRPHNPLWLACSPACQHALERRTKEAGRARRRVKGCLSCGRRFQAHDQRQKNCSAECRRLWRCERWRRRRERSNGAVPAVQR